MQSPVVKKKRKTLLASLLSTEFFSTVRTQVEGIERHRMVLTCFLLT